MLSVEQWEPHTGNFVPLHKSCAVQSRQMDSSCASWGNFMNDPQQQLQHIQESEALEEEHMEQQCPSSMRPTGCKRGGRPVTWIGGGGMDPKKLAGLGVPVLRTLFSQVFGQETASNNAAWLRRKLAEAPDSVHGQRRSPVVRARDQGAAIWNQGDDPALADHECGDHHHHQQQQNYQEGGTFAAGSMSLTSMQEPAEVSLQQQMQLDGVASGMDSLMMRAANTGTTPAAPAPGSPAQSGQKSPSSAAASPRAAAPKSPSITLGKRSRQMSSKAAQHQQQQQQQEEQERTCYYASGVPIRPHTINDGFAGRKVLVYWPADQQWWEATLCKVHTALKQVQLLYADMTEECVSGRDYDDMLANGHLLEVYEEDQEGDNNNGNPAAGGDSQMPTNSHLGKPAATDLTSATTLGPGAVPCQSQGPQDTSLSGLSALTQPGRDTATGVQRHAGHSQGRSVRDGSSASAAAAATTPGSPGAAAAATVTTHNSSRRSTADGFRLTASGSGSGGSGNNSGSCNLEAEGAAAAKRQCYELSGVSSDAAAAEAGNMTVEASGAPAAVAPAGAMGVLLQQQGVLGDASQLGLWFANQQLQQLHLQEQVQHNLELQQQAHLQMQQQMAAHMQMRMAGQYMQQQMGASSLTLAGAAVAAAAAAGMFGMPAVTANNAGMVAEATSAGLPALPAISAPPNVMALQQQQQLESARAAAAAAGQAMSPMAAMAYYSPLAASAAAASAALNAATCGFQVPTAYSPAELQAAMQQQQVQQAANLAASAFEPTSPLAAAAAAAAAAATAAAWPQTTAMGGGAATPSDDMPSAVAAVAAAAVAVLSGGPGAASGPPTALMGAAYGRADAQGATQQLSQGMSAEATAPSVQVTRAQLCSQLPLPQVLPQLQAPLQAALPEGRAPAVPAVPAVTAWQAAPSVPARSALAAAGGSKPAKAVSINPEAEYRTFAQDWLELSPDGGDGSKAAAAAGAALRQQQKQRQEAAAPGRRVEVVVTRPVTPAVPSVSGTTAGCVSGFTGGVQGIEAPDEVDTLLSRPEEGLYGGLDAEGCGGCEDGWGLLTDMSGGAGGSQGFMCQPTPGAGGDQSPEQGSLAAAMRESEEPSSSSCAEGAATVSEDAGHVASGPPGDSALAHVFDYS